MSPSSFSMAAFVVVPSLSCTCKPSSHFPKSTALAVRAASSSRSTFLTGSNGILLQPAAPRHAAFPQHPTTTRKRMTPTAMGGGGFLGVGPAEVVVIIAVGWFLLGPTKLYELAKDSGKIIGELRRTADEARGTFQEALELELEKEKSEKAKLAADDSETDNPLEQENSTEPTSTPTSSTEPISRDQYLQSLSTSEVTSPSSSASPTSTPTDSSEELEELIEGPAINSQFLDQLKRVADPDQKPPSDVPDLDVSIETEEQELERLEKQYLEARSRLEARNDASKTVSNTSTPGENSSISQHLSDPTESSGSKTS